MFLTKWKISLRIGGRRKNLTHADRGEGGVHKNLTFADVGDGGIQNGLKHADVINEQPLIIKVRLPRYGGDGRKARVPLPPMQEYPSFFQLLLGQNVARSSRVLKKNSQCIILGCTVLSAESSN